MNQVAQVGRYGVCSFLNVLFFYMNLLEVMSALYYVYIYKSPDVTPFEAVHSYTCPSLPPDMISVVAKKLSFPILCGVPTACMLSRCSLKPPGPVTDMLRALPPLEVHLTLNVPSLPDSISILAVADETERDHKSVFTIELAIVVKIFYTA